MLFFYTCPILVLHFHIQKLYQCNLYLYFVQYLKSNELQILRFGRFDWQKQAIDLGTPQAGRVHQQNHVGWRGCALGFESGENTGIVGVHPVDLDARGFGEVAVHDFIGGVVTGRVNVQHFVLCHDRGGCPQAGEAQERFGQFHELDFQWVLMVKFILNANGYQ